MKNVMAVFLLFTSVIFSCVSNAEGEIESWYLSKGGEYLVRESIDGSLYSLLSTSKAGDLTVYMFMFDASCKDENSDVINHNPLYVNNKLVRFSQYCDGERRYFFPSSDAGRNHIVNEFKKKEFVEVKAHDNSYTKLFSAKGFTKIYNEMKLKSEAI
ncbi:hypothetical protein [Vibrio navarrensis]|uniref:hypothetical protein n=1 Tax=Vibrio navarrensis TaxID=29495 RepID=UPI00186A82DE|nr:hypothetical protein [Vibrio navarrensis]MBE4618264.1 hypothetical protein [Vibrio navarrensis]MBH9738666.1 hypothetical protein [Vibrio navarrensis]